MNFAQKHFGRLGNSLFQYAYIYAQFKDGVIPDIYLQNSKYFDKYQQEIQQLFGTDIHYVNKVSIHIRRGDYVTTHKDFYTDLNATDYYKKAMEMFPNSQFLMFSDDITWCMRQWEYDKRIQFSLGRTEEEDLKLMAGCKSNIIANSSFSWWAAYLNPNIEKKVIYPKNWYADGQQRTVCPSDWIAL